ncbi:MAG: hypothetical protein KKF65_07255, partial [Nanoarchaeota archaeon]|nr:hypothetical protein [Nanoarchaeota archaeon]
MSIEIDEDIQIQIEAQVKDSIESLLAEKENSDSEKDYDWKIITSIPEIRLDITEDGRIVMWEEFEYEAPTNVSAHKKINGEKFDFEKETTFSGQLKKIRLSNLVLKEINSTSENSNSPKIFINWITQEPLVEKFITKLELEYPDTFSKFSHHENVDKTTKMMLYTFEKRMRASNIEKFIEDNYEKYIPYFNNELEAKIYSTYEWFNNESETWHTQDFKNKY